MIPHFSRRLSRSVKIFVAMASGDSKNSLKDFFFRKSMSRMTKSVHLSPIKSKVLVMGQLERSRHPLIFFDFFKFFITFTHMTFAFALFAHRNVLYFLNNTLLNTVLVSKFTAQINRESPSSIKHRGAVGPPMLTNIILPL